MKEGGAISNRWVGRFLIALMHVCDTAIWKSRNPVTNIQSPVASHQQPLSFLPFYLEPLPNLQYGKHYLCIKHFNLLTNLYT